MYEFSGTSAKQEISPVSASQVFRARETGSGRRGLFPQFGEGCGVRIGNPAFRLLRQRVADRRREGAIARRQHVQHRREFLMPLVRYGGRAGRRPSQNGNAQLRGERGGKFPDLHVRLGVQNRYALPRKGQFRPNSVRQFRRRCRNIVKLPGHSRCRSHGDTPYAMVISLLR